MARELSLGKTWCILAIVAGCFALLFPNILYPIIKATLFQNRAEDITDCCDVLLDKDVNGVKLVSELCKVVHKQSEAYRNSLNVSLLSSSRSPKDSNMKYCRSVVMNTCGVDIHVLLQDKISLGPSYKRTLQELRTVNKSLCLKYHFDVTLDLLGAPHRVKKFNTTAMSTNYRQERVPYVRPNGVHPIIRDRGRPLPHSRPQIHITPGIEVPPAAVLNTKKPSTPVMRPPMGGGSHVPAYKGSGSMSILMPMYTIGIVIFFCYTIMKLLCKKQNIPKDYVSDPEFCRIVFNNNSRDSKAQNHEKSNGSVASDPTPRLVVSAISGLLQEVNRDILEREEVNNETFDKSHKDDDDEIVQVPSSGTQEASVTLNGEINADNTEGERSAVENCCSNEDDNVSIEEKDKSVIEVLSMELSERCENGQLWKHQERPVLRKRTPPSEIKRQEIILPTNVPLNSQILVTDAHTESVASEPSVILESKVTLNVISPELKNGGIHFANESGTLTPSTNGNHDTYGVEEEEVEYEDEEDAENDEEEVEKGEECSDDEEFPNRLPTITTKTTIQ